jgi:hypothetical protein
MKQSFRVVDPCQTALADCLGVLADGRIHWLSTDGHRLVRILGLDAPQLVEFRAAVIDLLKESEAAYRLWMSYPSNLPDLTLPPNPPFNSKPHGVMQSYHAQKQRGELPNVY